jgi:hypothetical protein
MQIHLGPLRPELSMFEIAIRHQHLKIIMGPCGAAGASQNEIPHLPKHVVVDVDFHRVQWVAQA